MTLRVTLEVIPFGIVDNKYKIGCMDISNMGSFNGKEFVYRAIQYDEKDKFVIESVDGSLAHCRDDGPWWLVRKALSLKGFTN